MRLGELAGALYIVSLARPSLASQPYFPPCAHARMISGWGEGRGKYVMAGISFL